MSETSGHSSDASLPGRGLFGWLGRQVGYVRHAIRHEPAEKSEAIFRSSSVREQPLPDMPHVKLRRTTIDEVVIEKQVTDQKPE
ncbi:MAG: hypothetical protein JO353_01545 [Phycisphaerae bacterium]|nr:hypothetical protein [Phycisphaerae bacterium]